MSPTVCAGNDWHILNGGLDEVGQGDEGWRVRAVPCREGVECPENGESSEDEESETDSDIDAEVMDE